MNILNFKSSNEIPHLLIYLDVNKTMIMLDPIQGKIVPNVINDLFSEIVYGYVNPKTNEWIWNNEWINYSTIDQKKKISNDIITYSNYLRQAFPKCGTQVEMKINKMIRKEKRAHFTNVGHPGEKLHDEYKKVIQFLTLPQDIQKSELALQAGLDTEYMYILPSIFHFIQYLDSKKYNFNIIIRTFGEDIEHLAKEFNSFCEGKHPMYQKYKIKMDGSNGSIDRRIHLEDPKGFGTFYRNDKKHETTTLIMGTLHQPTKHEDGLSYYHQNNIKGNPFTMINGLDKIHNYLKHLFQEKSTIALRDYYHWWWMNYESSDAGKLCSIDPNDSNVHVVFFDDNILQEDPHIVDICNIHTGQRLSFLDVQHIHLIRVEPLQAITNLDYFINKIQNSFKSLQTRNSIFPSLHPKKNIIFSSPKDKE